MSCLLFYWCNNCFFMQIFMLLNPEKLRLRASDCGAVSFFAKAWKKRPRTKQSFWISEFAHDFAETHMRSRNCFLRRSWRTHESIMLCAQYSLYLCVKFWAQKSLAVCDSLLFACSSHEQAAKHHELLNAQHVIVLSELCVHLRKWRFIYFSANAEFLLMCYV